MVLLAVNLTTTALTGRQLDGHWQMQVGISELPHTARLTLWTDFFRRHNGDTSDISS